MDTKKLPSIEKFSFEGVNFSHEGFDATLKNCEFQFPGDAVVRVHSERAAHVGHLPGGRQQSKV